MNQKVEITKLVNEIVLNATIMKDHFPEIYKHLDAPIFDSISKKKHTSNDFEKYLKTIR